MLSASPFLGIIPNRKGEPAAREPAFPHPPEQYLISVRRGLARYRQHGRPFAIVGLQVSLRRAKRRSARTKSFVRALPSPRAPSAVSTQRAGSTEKEALRHAASPWNCCAPRCAARCSTTWIPPAPATATTAWKRSARTAAAAARTTDPHPQVKRSPGAIRSRRGFFVFRLRSPAAQAVGPADRQGSVVAIAAAAVGPAGAVA